VVKKDGKRLFLYPLENIQQLVIVGRVEISTAMLGVLMRRGIGTTFLSRDGRFKGKVLGGVGKDIFIREKQFQRRTDPKFCLTLSRQIISAKIRNCRNFLRKQQPAVYEDSRVRIQNALKNIPAVRNLNMLRGIEGAFSAYYFSLFSRLLRGDFSFHKRTKHPPRDPVNILLSLGYTLLFNTIYGLVEAAGLDPFAGFYHLSSYGHPALVSDLMEPYRAPVVDRLVIHCLNQGIIQKSDFTREEDKLRLSPSALKTFVEFYQNRLYEKIKINNRQEDIWRLLQKDIWQFKSYLEGEIQNYQPKIFR